MMGYIYISRKRIRNVLSLCVSQVYINALETMVLKEKQQVQVCKSNNLVRNIVRVKRANIFRVKIAHMRRMDETRVEI